MARRLASDALSELGLMLDAAYQLGYHKMFIYPFRPDPGWREAQPPPKAEPAEPMTPDR